MDLQNLLFQLIWLIPLLFVLNFCFRYILQPYLKLTKLTNQIKGKYSAYRLPFLPYGVSSLRRILKDFKQYGDCFRMKKYDVSSKDLFLTTVRDQLYIGLVKEELVQQFIQKQKEGYYVKSGGNSFASFKSLLGNGLLFSESDEWRYKRKVMSTLFNFDFIKSKFGMISKIAKQTCQQAKVYKEDGKIQIEVGKLFQTIFGTVVIRCFFGDIKLNTIRGKNIFQFLSTLIDKIGKRTLMFSSFLFGKFFIKYGLRKIDREINDEISLFREYTKKTIQNIIQLVEKNELDANSEGLVAKLLKQKRLVKNCAFNEKIEKGYYTYEDLINEMCTFFVAGTDTTSNIVTSLVHKFVEKKQIQQHVRREISQVLSNQIGNISLDSLKKMDYLRYAQLQILRFMPAAPQIFARQALKDHKIGEINIPKGSLVTIEILANHYKEQFFKNAHQFIPERWEKLQNSTNISHHFLPFFFGPRVCIGRQLALIQSKIAIIIFLLNFKNGEQEQPPRYKFGLAYGPQKSLMKFDSV